MGRTVVANRYELRELVSEGRLGAVWRGRLLGPLGFERDVAVRTLRDDIAADEELTAILADRMRAAASLHHPHLVSVFDMATDEDDVFIVMQWVTGLPLPAWCDAQRAAGEAVPWWLVAGVGVEILSALAAAHDRRDRRGRPASILHRDVCPGAILLGADGVSRLDGLGMADVLERMDTSTARGARSYRAPELIEGGAPSPESDIYALGAVLFEALAGQKLFEAATLFELEAQIREGGYADLSTLRPDVPQSLVAIIERALDRDPGGRHESAWAMARALRQLLRTASEPTDARALGRSVRDAMERLLPLGLLPSSTQEVDLQELEEVGSRPPPGIQRESTDDVELGELSLISEAPPLGQREPEDLVDPEEVWSLSTPASGSTRLDEEEADPGDVESLPMREPLGFELLRRARVDPAAVAPLPGREPTGLTPARTEYLEGDEVDALTVKEPTGLKPARTEYLGGDEVDALTVKEPTGLKPARTEYLEGDEVDALTVKEPTGLKPARTEYLEGDEVDALRVEDDEET